MDFKDGDICFTHFVNIEECKILKVYPKSNRYKVLQGSWERTVKAYELFKTKEDVVQNLINTIDKKITYLEEEKVRIAHKYK